MARTARFGSGTCATDTRFFVFVAISPAFHVSVSQTMDALLLPGAVAMIAPEVGFRRERIIQSAFGI